MDDAGVLVLQLIIGVVLGFIAAAIASNKGRSGVGWFFAGFFLGIIPIIIVACLSDLKEEQNRYRRDADEKRRLREQLKQEQLKNEAMRQYTVERLDAHDEALGIDTSQTQTQIALPGAPAPAPQLASSGAAVEQTYTEVAPVPTVVPTTEWYYSNDPSQQNGPYSQHEIEQLIAAGEISSHSLVWNANLVEWAMAGEIADLQAKFLS